LLLSDVQASIIPPYLFLHILVSPSFYSDHDRHLRSFYASVDIVVLVPLDLAAKLAFGPTHTTPAVASKWDRNATDDGGALEDSGAGGGGGPGDAGAAGGGPQPLHLLATTIADARKRNEGLTVGGVLTLLWREGGPDASAHMKTGRGLWAGFGIFPSADVDVDVGVKNTDTGIESSVGNSNGMMGTFVNTAVKYAPSAGPLARSVGNSIMMEGFAFIACADPFTSALVQFLHLHSMSLHGMITGRSNLVDVAYAAAFRVVIVVGNVQHGIGWWFRTPKGGTLLPSISGAPAALPVYALIVVPFAFVLVGLDSASFMRHSWKLVYTFLFLIACAAIGWISHMREDGDGGDGGDSGDGRDSLLGNGDSGSDGDDSDGGGGGRQQWQTKEWRYKQAAARGGRCDKTR
jgi:uncharacterized membrane protein YgcG